ncbi:hypothetical protein VNO80_04371 [Phaseolus coccineus]|uniref:Uncharacterized protein n=1 Tax=Phaseolus coccineus TaxID=3886 RepID=A0AAN9NXR7_PHACN
MIYLTVRSFNAIKAKSLLLADTRSMDMKNPFDVPSYMLLEASGDSETDCNPTVEEHGCEIDREDDDALSCVYDSSETCNAAELNGYEFRNNDHVDDVEDEKKCEVRGTSYCDDDDEMQEHQKSCVSDESGHELVDEMERNRRFWEACLAS